MSGLQACRVVQLLVDRARVRRTRSRLIGTLSSLICPLLLLGLVGCTDNKSLADGVLPLAIGPAAEQTLAQEPAFSRVTLPGGLTYTFPFTMNDLFDDGWEDEPNIYGPTPLELEGYSAHLWVALRHPDGGAISVTVLNASPEPEALEDCQVYAVQLWPDDGEWPAEAGATEEDVMSALGLDADYLGLVPDRHGIMAYRTPLPRDLVEELGFSIDRSSPQVMAADGAGIRIVFGDEGMRMQHYVSAPPESISFTMLQEVGFSGAQEGESLRFEIPFQLRNLGLTSRLGDLGTLYFPGVETRVNGFVDGVGGYTLDGDRYALGASNRPKTERMRYSTVAEQEKYLLNADVDLLSSQVDLGGEPETSLLWNHDDSSAAVVLFHGQGKLTGTEVLQAQVNYCDWRAGNKVTLLFSMARVEQNGKVTERAKNRLLQVALDVAQSISWQHSAVPTTPSPTPP